MRQADSYNHGEDLAISDIKTSQIKPDNFYNSSGFIFVLYMSGINQPTNHTFEVLLTQL